MPTILASRRCLISCLLSRIDLAANLMHIYIRVKPDVGPSVSHMTATQQAKDKKDEKCRFNIHLHGEKSNLTWIRTRRL